MTDIWFYHLERTSLEQALPELLEKVMGRGWRAYVHGLEDDTIAGLDSHLWSYSPASFLAHGREDEPFAERQPILLGKSGKRVNGAEVYVSVAPADIPDLTGTERALIVFEDRDADHLAWARAQWKKLKGEGLSLAYWKQSDTGRWEKMQ
jgi:DNA polymerase III subunit chi